MTEHTYYYKYDPLSNYEQYVDNIKDYLNAPTSIFTKLDGSIPCRLVWKKTGGINYYTDSNIITKSIQKKFKNYIKKKKSNLVDFFKKFPKYHLYGSFLTQELESHNRPYLPQLYECFYIEDVYNSASKKFISYDRYKKILFKFNLLYNKRISLLNRPSLKDLNEIRRKNNLLIDQKKYRGTSNIIIKNYNKSKYFILLKREVIYFESKTISK